MDESVGKGVKERGEKAGKWRMRQGPKGKVSGRVRGG